MKRIFPIQTETSCLLKWAWSTVYLYRGTTSSCHRVAQNPIDPDNFGDFHNLPEKLQARRLMLSGQWPGQGCEYCQSIEQAGGISDRQHQLTGDHHVDKIPPELLTDPTAVEVTPTVLEVYFNNTCNMACVYCGEHFSTKWADENRRWGEFKQDSVAFGHRTQINPNYDRMLADFWQWLAKEEHYRAIRYFQILGGEPFYQKEFDVCLDFWQQHPNPDLAFNIISNLKVPHTKFRQQIDRFETMVQQGQINRLQITGSLDAWGPEEEYVRWGLDLSEWQQNFEYLLDKPWIHISVNLAICSLTIKTMPELIQRINAWQQRRPPGMLIHFSYMSVMTPAHLQPEIFGAGVFDQDFDRIIQTLDQNPNYNVSVREHLQGIFKRISGSTRDPIRIGQLKTYLTELDRRRGTDWRSVFPWLDRDWH